MTDKDNIIHGKIKRIINKVQKLEGKVDNIDIDILEAMVDNLTEILKE